MTDNITSQEAYEVVEQQLPELCQDVVKAIQEARNGLTCYEVEAALGLSHQTASAVLTRLRRYEGRVYKSGTRRHPDSGRRWNVYKPAHGDVRAIDPQCGDGGPNASHVTREAVVAYLAYVTDHEWMSILSEATALHKNLQIGDNTNAA
jgi:hypothetical protein